MLGYLESGDLEYCDYAPFSSLEAEAITGTPKRGPFHRP